MKSKNWNGTYDAEVEDLVGMTILEIIGLKSGSDTVKFVTSEGRTFQMHYYQDCYANCTVEDVIGDINDLIGVPLTMAELVISGEPDASTITERKADYEKRKAEKGEDFYSYGPTPENGWKDESETWSFYKFATVKGYVTIRWYGSSNGYYSETTTFEEL